MIAISFATIGLLDATCSDLSLVMLPVVPLVKSITE